MAGLTNTTFYEWWMTQFYPVWTRYREFLGLGQHFLYSQISLPRFCSNRARERLASSVVHPKPKANHCQHLIFLVIRWELRLFAKITLISPDEIVQEVEINVMNHCAWGERKASSLRLFVVVFFSFFQNVYCSRNYVQAQLGGWCKYIIFLCVIFANWTSLWITVLLPFLVYLRKNGIEFR